MYSEGTNVLPIGMTAEQNETLRDPLGFLMTKNHGISDLYEIDSETWRTLKLAPAKLRLKKEYEAASIQAIKDYQR